jgi:hypothetical protein
MPGRAPGSVKRTFLSPTYEKNRKKDYFKLGCKDSYAKVSLKNVQRFKEARFVLFWVLVVMGILYNNLK